MELLIMEEVREILRHYDINYRIVRPDGTVRMVHEIAEIQPARNGAPARLIGIIHDITGEKDAEFRLAESEEKFRLVAESAADAIIISDANGNINSWNRGAEKIFGRREEEVLGKPITTLMPEEFRSAHRRGLEAFIKSGKRKMTGTTRELKGVRKDGGVFPIELSLSAWEAARGIYFSAIIRNITERKHAEAALRLESEITANAAEGIVLTRASDGTIIYVNRRFESMFGYSNGELLGRHVSILNAPVEESPEKIAREIMHELEMSGVWRGELLNIRKDGTTFWTFSSVVTHNHHEYGKVWIAHQTDISEIKKLEQEKLQLAAAVKYAADGIVLTDAGGFIKYLNPAYEEITGYRLEEVRGLTPRVFNSGRQDGAFYEELWNTIKGGRVWRGNLINRKKNGTLYDEKITISPITDADGKIVNFVAVKHDITDETALRKAREYFTVITAHELRTPMTMLKLLMSLIDVKRGGTLGPDDIERVAAIMEDAYGALDDIMAATSLIADLRRPHRSTDFTNIHLLIELKAVLGVTGDMLKKEKRDVRLTADLDAWPRGLTIRGNKMMVSRMMDNILSNAVKYTPDGKAVLVTAKLETGFAVLEVSDEGIGIPGDRMRAIFEPYFALESPNHHSTGRYKFMGGGIGLGLTVSRLIMEYHGGTLTIDSEGLGANVTLRFPLGDGAAPEALPLI